VGADGGLWRRYVRPAIPTLLCVYVPLGALLVLVKLASPDQHASALVEPEWSPGASWTRGSLWVAGLAGWSVALGACLVGALRPGQDPARRRLLAGAGLLSLVMLADDVWQLHKPEIPDATGVPSAVVLLAYGAAFGLWLWAHRRAIADSDAGLLAVALGFFALWVLLKGAPGVPGRIAVSSGAKLCGIAGWAAYLVRTARVPRPVTPRVGSDPARA
jgi:hypothetical protein